MGDEQVAEVQLFLQPGQQLQNLVLHQHVQRGHGLIQHNHLWVQRQCSGHRDALALTARQLVWVATHG